MDQTAMTKPIKINPFFYYDRRYNAERNRRLRAKVEAHIRKCLKKFPDICEGVITLNGFEHWFIYVVREDCVDA
jgi:hypothetical protein